jgi:integrase
MSYGKRPKLVRGLRWKPTSPHICFSWRDERGSQHQQSTNTADPAEAMAFKLKFLREKTDAVEERRQLSEDRSCLPLEKAAELYFNWKAADISPRTIAREKRLFKSVERFIGPKRPVRSINLGLIEEYQVERRKQISPTMKKAVTTRTVNYELRLLRGVMRFAKCWKGDLTEGYQPLRQKRRRVGRVATKDELMNIIATAKTNEYWELAMYCAAVAAGTGCRSWEIKNLRLGDIRLATGTILIREEIAKNRQEREPRLMALAEWGLHELLFRARQLGASEPEHYLLPLNLRKSRHWSKKTTQKWDVTQPMTTWVKSWRKLMEKCKMRGFRFHDLRHTFRTQGAEAGVPLEVMMAQLGHMDRETSLEYVHIQQRAFERAKALIEQEQAEIVFAAKGGVRNNPAGAKTATAATRIALPELAEHHDAKSLRRVPRSSP